MYTPQQGWLKSINSPYDAERDPGRDGIEEMPNGTFAPDLFGMALDYFTGDYARAGMQVQSNPEPPAVTPYADRYTGLVRAQRWNNRALDDPGEYRFGGQSLMYWTGYH